MDKLLFEIGTEEIPAGYIAPALAALAQNLLAKLDAARIRHGQAEVFGTPRRLAVLVREVASKQETLTAEVLGPPEKVAYDADGNAMVPAIKFAEKVGLDPDALEIKETPKGRYLCALKTEEGLKTVRILEAILPEVLFSIPFPKTMRWSDLKIEFARPIHGLVALLGADIIPFTVGRIKSGRTTVGHRFMAPEKIALADADGYIEALAAAHVYADIKTRRGMVQAQIDAAAEQLGGRILPDESLLDVVTQLIECPAATAGHFDAKFLELPREILITAMREHQKYFAVIDAADRLMPCFVAVNNTRAKDMALVASGHERVLRARLADARFFYHEDLEETMESRVEKLKRVLFQAKLGTVHERVIRVQKLAGFLADAVSEDAQFKKDVRRAALLCKADLVSQVVVEFPKLQGVMGRVYAAIDGETEHVSAAIEDHYRPTYSGGPLPETTTGTVLSIADKMDTICGCFSVGLIPTGASDPYALRRQGIGIIQIMLKNRFSFSLTRKIEKNVKLFGARSAKEIKETVHNVYTFLRNRMVHLLAEEGYSKDVIAAVVAVSVDHVPAVWQKVQALEKLKAEPDFEPLATAFKRVVNIIKKAGMSEAGLQPRAIDETRFSDPSEYNLHNAYLTAAENVSGHLEKDAYGQALLDIAALKAPVDAFFDAVMVMSDDAKVRKNRLALLGRIAGLFNKLADFSKISA